MTDETKIPLDSRFTMKSSISEPLMAKTVQSQKVLLLPVQSDG